MDPLNWFDGLSLAWKIAVGVIAALLLWLAYNFVSDLFTGTAKVEARLGTEQAGAAIESGQDAVDTVGSNQDASDQTDDKVEGIQDDVDEADSSAGATSAGLGGLCEQFSVGCEE